MIHCNSCNQDSEYPIKDEGGFMICPICASSRFSTEKISIEILDERLDKLEAEKLDERLDVIESKESEIIP